MANLETDSTRRGEVFKFGKIRGQMIIWISISTCIGLRQGNFYCGNFTNTSPSTFSSRFNLIKLGTVRDVNSKPHFYIIFSQGPIHFPHFQFYSEFSREFVQCFRRGSAFTWTKLPAWCRSPAASPIFPTRALTRSSISQWSASCENSCKIAAVTKIFTF